MRPALRSLSTSLSRPPAWDSRSTPYLRMVGNVTVETIVGVIPIIGDIFDFAWKANRRNMALLRAYEGQPGPRERSPSQILRLFLVPMIVVVLGLVALPILALGLIFRLIF